MKRISEHPVLGPLSEKGISFEFNGTSFPAIEGDSVASALLASNVRTLRYSHQGKEPRGIYCGIGHCYECRVTVDGAASVRACITPVVDGMIVESRGQTQPETEG